MKISREWHLQMKGVCSSSSCFHLLGDKFKMQAFQIWVSLLDQKHLEGGLTFSVQAHGVPVPLTIDLSQRTVGKS